MHLSEQFPDPVTGVLVSVKTLAESYNLPKSTVKYRLKHNIAINTPVAKSGASSKTMKSTWVKRKQEMANVIANMKKRKW